MINIFHNKLSILAIFLIGTVLFGGAIWLWIDLSSENKDNQNFAKTVQDEAGTNPVVSAPSVDEGLRSEIVFTDDFASADTLDESLTSAKINQEDNTVILSNVTVREHSIEEYLKQKTWGNEVWNMACADEYCLMVIKRDDHPNQVLRFDGESFTEVTAKVPNLSPVTEQGYLLRGGSGIIYATEKTVFNYDGSVFHDISPVLSNGDGGITAIGWNGNTIVVATGGQYSGPASTIYLLSSSGQLIRKDEVFTNYGRPQITSIVWGKDSWLLGAYDDWGTYFIVAEYFTDGSWNEVTDKFPPGLSYNMGNTIWDGDSWNLVTRKRNGQEMFFFVFDGSTVNELTQFNSHLNNYSSAPLLSKNGENILLVLRNRNTALSSRGGDITDVSEDVPGSYHALATQRDKTYIAAGNILYELTYHYQDGVVVSKRVNEVPLFISIASLEYSEDEPENTEIQFSLSNDGGRGWVIARAGEPIAFPSSGYDLRWKAEMKTSDPLVTPSISEVTIRYNAKPALKEWERFSYNSDTERLVRIQDDGTTVDADTPYAPGTYHADVSPLGILIWKRGEERNGINESGTRFSYEYGRNPEFQWYDFDAQTFSLLPEFNLDIGNEQFERILGVYPSITQRKLIIRIGYYDINSDQFKQSYTRPRPMLSKYFMLDIISGKYEETNAIDSMLELLERDSIDYLEINWDSLAERLLVIPHGQDCVPSIIYLVDYVGQSKREVRHDMDFSTELNPCGGGVSSSSDGKWYIFHGQSSENVHDFYLYDFTLNNVLAHHRITLEDPYAYVNSLTTVFNLPVVHLSTNDVVDFNTTSTAVIK